MLSAMKIYEGNDENGKLVYFEIPNIFLSRRSAMKIISHIPNVKILSIQKRKEVFCTFKLGDRVFEIWEPYGDSSRFHIGEKEVKNSNELEIIKKNFSAHKQWPLSLLSR